MGTFRNAQGDIVSEVSITPIVTSGTHIATINGKKIYAPNNGGGGGGSASEYTESLSGEAGIRIAKQSMGNGEYMVLSDYPYNNTVGDCYQFRAKITSFSVLKIGRGTNAANAVFAGAYHNWLEIDGTNIKVYHGSSDLIATYAHGLTISDFIAVNMKLDDDKKMNITLMSVGGMFTQVINPYTTSSTPYWDADATGMVKVASDGSSLTDCKLSATNFHFKSPLWIFGASYENHGGWQKQVRAMGFTNFLHNGYPGRASQSCFEDFVRATAFGFPKFLYWTMWGNGSAESLDTYIEQVKALCDAQSTTLVIIQRPNATNASDYANRKAVIDSYIERGVRYVDAASALSTDADSPSGWYSGYLSSDGIHPTQLGYKSLAMQVLQDLPEIMQYD